VTWFDHLIAGVAIILMGYVLTQAVPEMFTAQQWSDRLIYGATAWATGLIAFNGLVRYAAEVWRQ
jgi:hypothetical protein